MEGWHPILIIVLVALFPIFLFGYLMVLLAYQLPPIIFIPLIPAAVMMFYLYQSAVRKSYNEKNVKKLSALVISFAMIFAIPISVFEIMKPNWSFEMHTDKNVYEIGENVTIVIKITNNAYLTQSLGENSFSITAEFEVRNASSYLIEWNRFIFSESWVSVASGDSMQRTYTWFSLGIPGNYSIYSELATPYRSVYFTSKIYLIVE